MEAIILAFGPIVTMFLTSFAKSIIPSLAKLNKTGLRVIVAILAFGVTVGQVSLSGGTIDSSVAKELSIAFLNFLGATGTYLFAKYG